LGGRTWREAGVHQTRQADAEWFIERFNRSYREAVLDLYEIAKNTIKFAKYLSEEGGAAALLARSHARSLCPRGCGTV